MALFGGFDPGAAGGDWAKQAADAQAMADQMMKDSGYANGVGDVTMANAGEMTAAMGADQAKIQAQADEQNRILTIGSPAQVTITGKVDTGEKVAGNPVYQLDLSVKPESGDAYDAKSTQILPTVTLSSYADGSTLAARVDPADKNNIAFGEKPFK
jgi:hypothetical protein